MFSTLYSKLVAVLLGFGAMMGLLFIFVLRFSHDTYHLEAHQKVNRALASQLSSQEVLLKGNEITQDALPRMLDRLRLVNPGIHIYLLNHNGRILASSGPPERLKQSQVRLEPLKSFINDAVELPVFGDDPSDPARPKIFSAAPISITGQTAGYLYVILGGEEHDSVTKQLKKSYALRENMWVIGGGLVLGLLASLAMIGLLTRPLHRLTTAVDKFRQSGFLEQPKLSAGRSSVTADDIDRLSVTFNEMADRLLKQMQELKDTDIQRRELIANISHDLRTPLASLQGHLETLLHKEPSLGPEEKQNYLEIALRETGVLTKLTRKLFELAKLDAELVSFSPEPFTLGDLVQDVEQKFALAAAEKGVKLTSAVPDELPVVVADIGLVERVLENLIENALRYTPQGGTVSISLMPEHQHIQVQVSDTGCGIAPEDLPRIFDRFYRGEKSRPTPSDSAGLGLAIAKRIMELHGSAIVVESAPGRGTTFSFRLPTCAASTDTTDESTRPAALLSTAGPASLRKPAGNSG